MGRPTSRRKFVEIHVALERLGVDAELLAIVSSWRDTRDDAEVHAGEVYSVLERLGADEELLAIVGSWRDTLSEEEVLAMLREFNTTERVLHRPQ